jgi:hypothetical protein
VLQRATVLMLHLLRPARYQIIPFLTRKQLCLNLGRFYLSNWRTNTKTVLKWIKESDPKFASVELGYGEPSSKWTKAWKSESEWTQAHLC